ncbi:endonuclease V [Ignicoccus islandicus DSM 13165]|uniref:Endonuclease V n=1 Tax=Ignicoccus islandicus DSM 13165 TaxID=940295 RepID=A0A0U2U6B2_9CREN|nr:endonuclease V [Ignicoccus islandicus]ALU11700.1 endonuclease V [Ignicoccus islandicus DSM 13165]
MKFDVGKAKSAQLEIAKRIVREDCFEKLKSVGGLDVSYSRNRAFGVAVLSILDYNTRDLLEIKYSYSHVPIPYIPTFLAFREVPLYYPLVKKADVDVILVDGHGIAHPRGAGVASHVGVVADKPTIGIAKKRLYGKEGNCDFGQCLFDDNGNVIAVTLRKNKKELFVSIGHCVSLKSAVEITKKFLKYGLPEPIRISDTVSRRLAKSWFGNPWLPKR